MPSVSKKQHNLMAAVAHNPAFAKKVGIPQSVGMDFNKADKGKTFKGGGMAKSDMKEDTKMDKAQDKAMIKKAFKQHDKQEHKGGKGTMLSLKKGGKACMAEGGEIETETAQGQNKNISDETRRRAMEMVNLDVNAEPRITKDAPRARPRAKMREKANAMAGAMSRMNPAGDTYKAGGKVSQLAKANGCAVRGKTKGRII